MKNIVSMQELQGWIKEGVAGLVIVDCRFMLGKPLSGREAYEEGHIPGAVYLDLEKDLSAPIGEHGGRHPLPDIAVLTGTLSRVGIGNASRVVAYDDQGGAMASRLWWLLKYLGHDEVYVMDKGFSAWAKAGNPVTAEVSDEVAPVTFFAIVRHNMLAEMDEVKDLLGSDRITLIDSREAPRYRGEVEPIDRLAGHIPGAINRFWKDALGDGGAWKDAAGQVARFEGLARDGEVIVYCGSGATACPNVVALKEAGFEKVRLYAGSWSDWISKEDNPIATGDEGKQRSI